jgi:predicted metal-dependent hydrolase
MPFEYTIVRKNRKSIAITVTQESKIVVKAPLFAKDALISYFVNQKTAWIQKVLERNSHKNTINVFTKEINEKSVVVFLGKRYSVSFYEGESIYTFDGQIYIPFMYKSDTFEKLIQWYKSETRTICKKILDTYSVKTGYVYKQCCVTSAKTRWASCSHDNVINCSWRLVALPVGVIEYIMVHELAHIKEKNHSNRFWKLVEEIMPEYLEQKEWLKKHRHIFPA